MNLHHFISFSEKYNWIKSVISNLNFFLPHKRNDIQLFVNKRKKIINTDKQKIYAKFSRKIQNDKVSFFLIYIYMQSR